MRQAVPSPLPDDAYVRIGETLRYYQRRTMRWVHVLIEGRPGTVRPSRGQRRVLVVRLDAIGDFVLWSGAARALREWLGPETHVTLAANAAWADLARDANIADEVWPMRRGPLEMNRRYRADMHARVRAGGFSLTINPRYTREMLFGDSVVRWSRAAERIGMVGESVLLPARERRWADGWYTTLYPTTRESMHEAERHLDFLRALGLSLDRLPPPCFSVPKLPPDSELARLGPYFVVFVGASLAEHRWPASRFAEVARAIEQRTGWRPMLLGDLSDIALTATVAAQLPRAANLTGVTTVPVLASLIQGSRLVLTNDTAAVHLAAATGVHAVCIAGGWHWDRFVPYPESLGAIAGRVHAVSMIDEMPCFRCNGYCTLPHSAGQPRPCLDRVSVERVMATVDHVLNLPGVQSDG
jgi:ADP-heptose:LPS heptosyltransferase